MKKKLHGAGTRMLEKLEHRETFFKEIPAKEDATITTMVPFMYPSALKETQVLDDFKALVAQRIPYHRKYMIYSALWVPVTSLFTIVPLVPNIPFFYNAFRLWSHWKAYQGAKHLDLLVKNGTIQFQPSDVLNLGLRHDPDFAIFFSGSDHLSKKRHRKAHAVQETKKHLNTESSADSSHLTRGSGQESIAHSGGANVERTHTSASKHFDPLSMTDHVVLEGFITDAEIALIHESYEQTPSMMVREIKRARQQEAEKFVKMNLQTKSKTQ
ncbi:hypothetical protein BGZ98_007955 [Dissophora globulifera]|nr:hypothetical protein BGZ98_007955 [Dissophora globulifera]